MKQLDKGWTDNPLAEDLLRAIIANANAAANHEHILSVEVVRQAGMTICQSFAKEMGLEEGVIFFKANNTILRLLPEELIRYDDKNFTEFIFELPVFDVDLPPV